MPADFPFADVSPARIAEAIGNRVLALDPETLAKLEGLSGKIIEIDITAPAIHFFIVPSGTGLRLVTESQLTPDVSLRAPLSTFAKLALVAGASEDMATLRDLQITGDIELGTRFQRTLRGLDIDWEELAARVLGDVVAHKGANAVRAGAAWLDSAVTILARDAGEFLQFERGALPARVEVEEFMRAVDVLRADVARLEQRIARLRGDGA